MKKPIEWIQEDHGKWRKELSNGDVIHKEKVGAEISIKTDKLGTCYSGYNESLGDEICRKIISQSAR